MCRERAWPSMVRLWRWASVVSLCVYLSFEAILGYGRPRYDSARRLLNEVSSELESIKEVLVQFNAANGRYPTTEEGLDALDAFAARFTVNGGPLACLPGLHAYSSQVRSYARDAGAYRTEAEEFWEAVGAAGHRIDGIGGLEIGISGSGGAHLFFHGDVISPCGVPYCYVNAGDVPDRESIAALVPEDRCEMYSVRLDRDVYVFSLGAKVLWERDILPIAAARICLLGVILLSVCGWVGSWWQARKCAGREAGGSWRALAITMLVGIVLGVVVPMSWRDLTASVPESSVSAYASEVWETYRGELEIWHRRRLIGTESYRRRKGGPTLDSAIVDAIRRRGSSRPSLSCRPSGSGSSMNRDYSPTHCRQGRLPARTRQE